MSWFFLDSSIAGSVRYGVLDRNGVRVDSVDGRVAETLDACVERFEYLDQVDGVCVVAGPGPFSSIRIGVLYANLIAAYMQIPLVGVTREQAADLDRVRDDLYGNVYSVTEYVPPAYEAEPNIMRPVA